jgi:hypothetical protein
LTCAATTCLADLAAVLQVIREISAIEIDDGVVFDTGTARAEVIRDQDQYQGVRVIVTAALATARLVFHVDVNIGDPIVPGPQTVGLPRMLGGTLTIAGYPLPMIHAEKIVTSVERGQANTRWRDFADIMLLSRRHDTDGTQLQSAIKAVTAHRHIQITPLGELLDGFPALAQRKWITWITKQQLRDQLPDDFADLLQTVIAFADPALTHQVTGLTWRASVSTWQL